LEIACFVKDHVFEFFTVKNFLTDCRGAGIMVIKEGTMYDLNITPGTFTNTWESLKQYQCPAWFRDAKFGVWAHWGPQCVPMTGDWYARAMYEEGSPVYKYHVERYGHPSEFGYKDIIQLWKAERFDPDSLMKLYKRMGAKFFVSTGAHHDNFDLWNSRHHRWNAVEKGPKKDIVGLWKAAAEKYGLRFGVSEHLERSYSWFAVNKGSDKQGAYKGIPYDGNDPAYADLYLRNHLEDSSPGYPRNPSPEFVENFYLRIKDLVESYDPDWLYTDGGIPFGEVGLAMVANFYNHNMKKHGGALEAVYTLKDVAHLYPDLCHGEYQEGAGILDLERTIAGGIREKPWQTDTCIGEWYYKSDCDYKTPLTVLRQLVDVVSKNGTYLLSIPLRPDGTLDQKEEQIIADITAWLDINGEAVFSTRPYTRFGEGPRSEASQSNETVTSSDCTEADFRFTTKGSCLYAVCMNTSDTGRLTIRSLAAHREKLSAVEVLGSPAAARFTWSGEDCVVSYTPPDCPVPMHTVKLTIK
jgi:alpha-L-fucosidase